MVYIRMSSLLSLIHRRLFTTSSSSASTSASKLSSSSPLPNSTSSSSLTLEFLIDSCGLPLQSALSVSKKIQIQPNKIQNSQSVLQLLRAHHFTDSHITKLIQKMPKVLLSSVESTLKPKFDFFIRTGFVGKFLPDFIATNPAILHNNLDSFIKPHFESLKSVFGCSEDIVAVLKRGRWLCSFGSKDTMQRNIDFLRKEGVPFDRIAKLFRLHSGAMIYKNDRLICAVNALKNLGIESEDTIFIYALGVMVRVNESRWNERTEVLKSLGWSEEEVFNVFKRFPSILMYSEKKIRIAMDFLMNTMKLEHNSLISYPYFLGFSIDKRIRPRYNVIKVLQSKKLIELDKSICNVLKASEREFLKNYVSKYVDEVPGLLELYQGTGKLKNVDT